MSTAPGTVAEFGEQWTSYFHNAGYFASEELLADVLAPLVPLASLKGQSVAEIGCGNGRFLPLFANYASQVFGIEPSAAWENARQHTAPVPTVKVLNASVYDALDLPPLDHVFSIGVVHHLPDPEAALRQMVELVKPGGRVTIWVYGHEGNELYLALAGALRPVTVRVPHRVLHALSTALVYPLRGYINACRSVPLPMHAYMTKVLAPLDFESLRVNIYDQLNPSIAHYWKREEVDALMRRAGLVDVRLHHRHGYSWTATGQRPPG